MKLLIFTVLLGFNFTVQAETKEAFELAKSKVIERINKKINNLHTDVHRIEKILLTSTGFLITSMVGLIVAMIIKIF